MDYPGDPTGSSELTNWLKRFLRASRANRLLSGPGVRLRETAAGTVVEVIPQGASFTPDLHPFQLYRVSSGQVAEEDRDKPCYAVRSGYIELRPRWKDWWNDGDSALFNTPGNYSYYADRLGGGDVNVASNSFGDDVTHVAPSGALGTNGQYFALDVTPEEIFDVDQGVYYAFWIEVNDDTPDEYPDVQIKCRRFNPNNAGIYPLKPFPDTVYNNGIEKEIIQVAILQYSVGELGALYSVNAGVGVSSAGGDGYISQILRTNLVNRCDGIGLRHQGEFMTDEFRAYYPGDLVTYTGPDSPTDPQYDGVWMCAATGQNGGSVAGPISAGATFVYFANNTPPPAP